MIHVARKIVANEVKYKLSKSTNSIRSIKVKIETDSMNNLGMKLKDVDLPQDKYKATPWSNPKARAKGKSIISKYGAPTEICLPFVKAS